MFRFEGFREKWGAAYRDLSIINKKKLFFYIWFIFRRTLYLACAFFMFNHTIFQIMFLLYSSLATSMYVGYSRPMVWWRKVWLENINEWFVFTVTYHVIFFTDIIGSAAL